MKTGKMKRGLAACVAAAMMTAAFAPGVQASTYDYEMKYLYDTTFDCLWIEGEPTFGELVAFQSNDSFNLTQFINSSMGEKTAQNFYTYITYAQDPMNENLVAYWARKGLDKIQVGGEDEEDTSDRYYLYIPTDIQEGESLPVLFVNHGGGEPAFQAETFGFCQIAAEERIILIMAEDTSAENLYSIYEQVKAEYPVDETRVYATGSSAGASASKNLAAAYPDLLAGLGLLDASIGFTNGDEEQRAQLQENGMPMIFLLGTADKYNNCQLGGSTFNPNTVEEWNDLLAFMGYEEYSITAEESSELISSSLNIVEHLTGMYVQESYVLSYENTYIYVSPFTNDEGINDMTLVTVENRGHIPCGYDAEIVWEFLSSFTRDTETHESIYVG